MGVCQNYGYLFGGPHNQDFSVWGHIGVPVFRETTKSIQGLGCLSPNERLIPHWSVSVDSSLNGEPRLGKVCSGLSR